MGRRVRTIKDSRADATRFIHFDGRDQRGRLLPSGVYFCRAQTHDASTTRKIVIQR
jgi:hypothetical protein